MLGDMDFLPTGDVKMKSIPRPIGRFFLSLVVLFTFNGCQDEAVNNTHQIEGSGRLTTRVVDVSSFEGIVLAGIGEVFVTQDSVQSVRVEADDNVIDRLILDVREGNLNIGIQKASYSHVTIRIRLSMRSVEFLEVAGAGSFASVGPLVCDSLTCRIVGAGSMTLSGRATAQLIELQGAGSVHGFNLECSQSRIILSGTGSAEVNVVQRLEATITGIGSVVYAGNPPDVISHVTGLGSIRRR